MTKRGKKTPIPNTANKNQLWQIIYKHDGEIIISQQHIFTSGVNTILRFSYCKLSIPDPSSDVTDILSR